LHFILFPGLSFPSLPNTSSRVRFFFRTFLIAQDVFSPPRWPRLFPFHSQRFELSAVFFPQSRKGPLCGFRSCISPRRTVQSRTLFTLFQLAPHLSHHHESDFGTPPGLTLSPQLLCPSCGIGQILSPFIFFVAAVSLCSFRGWCPCTCFDFPFVSAPATVLIFFSLSQRSLSFFSVFPSFSEYQSSSVFKSVPVFHPLWHPPPHLIQLSPPFFPAPSVSFCVFLLLVASPSACP